MVRLLLDEPGLLLGRSGDRFVVRRGGVIVGLFYAGDVEEIVVARSGVVVSSNALRLAASMGVDVVVLGARGEAVGVMHGFGLKGFSMIRREQLRAYDDSRGVWLARSFVYGKIRGMIYSASGMPGWAGCCGAEALVVVGRLRELAGRVRRVGGRGCEDARRRLLPLEAEAARLYWGFVARVLPGFPGRVKRGAADPVNMSLNYAYGVLYAEATRAVLRAGLDPLAGYLHSDRWGRPSLTLDLVEEFRHIVADYAVLKPLLRGTLKPKTMRQGLLDWSTRRKIIKLMDKRLEKQVKHPYTKAKTSLRQAILLQATRIAKHLAREEKYKPLTLKPLNP